MGRPPTGGLDGHPARGAKGQEVPPLPPVGREREAAVLQAAIEAAERGEALPLVVSGDPGVGKTHLLAYACAAAAARGLRVVCAAAHPAERSLAYAPWMEALRGLIAGLSAGERRRLTAGLEAVGLLVPGLGLPAPARLGDPALERARLFECVVELFRRLGAGRAALLALDDLHWFDEDSLQLLHGVTRRAAGGRLLVVATLRGEGAAGARARQALEAVLPVMAVREERLEPLHPAAQRQLMRALLGGEPDGALHAFLAERAAGNPLFLKTLVAALAADGALGRTGRHWSLRQHPHWPSAGLRDLVRRCARDLDQVERALLRLLAAAGGSLPADVLGRAAGVGEAELAQCLERLDRCGLLDCGADGGTASVQLRHALFQEAVVADLAALELHALHARLARAWAAARPADAERVAAHLARAGPLGQSAEAVRARLAAAEAARARHAPAAELAHLRAAVALTEAGHGVELQATVLRHLGDALAREGERDAARTAWRRAQRSASARADGRTLAGVHRRLAEAEWERGAFGAAEAHVARGLAALGADADCPEAWELRATRARLLARSGEDAALAAALEEVAGRPCPEANPSARVAWWTARCTLALVQADYRASRALTARFVAEMEAEGDPLCLHEALDSRVRCLLTVGDVQGAREVARRQLALVDGRGSPALAWYAHWHLALADYLAGDWPSAQARLDGLLSLARRAGLRRTPPQALAVAVLLAVRRGRLAEAEQLVAEARALLGAFRGDRHVSAFVALAECVLATEAAEAHRVAATLPAVGAAAWHGLRPLALALEAEAAVVAGRADVAQAHLRRLRQLERAGGEVYAGALAAAVEGLLHRAAGDAGAAAAAFARAADGLGRMGMPAEAARWRVEQARAAPPRSDPALPQALAEALRVLAAVGAERTLARGRDAARRHGVCRVSGRARGPGTARRPAVSRREAQVLRLVAEGCTNREIAARLCISPHTVATHLKRLRERLGCRSRAVLVRRAGAEGWLGTEAAPGKAGARVPPGGAPAADPAPLAPPEPDPVGRPQGRARPA